MSEFSRSGQQIEDAIDQARASFTGLGYDAAAMRHLARVVMLNWQTIKAGVKEAGGNLKVINDCAEKLMSDNVVLRSALTQFVSACDTAPPTALMIELGVACKAARDALSQS